MESILSRFTNWSMHPSKKRIFSFQDGSKQDEALLGWKGASLCELTRLAIPVPPGFIISTETSLEFYGSGQKREGGVTPDLKLPEQLLSVLKAFIYDLEVVTGRKFGMSSDPSIVSELKEPSMPLLLSVRSGASCPVHKQSKTVLNLGLNDAIVEKLARCTNEVFALDCYSRFLKMFGMTVSNVSEEKYDAIISEVITSTKKLGSSTQEMTVADLRSIVRSYKELSCVPEDPWDQLQASIVSFYNIWFSKTFKHDREFHNIPEDAGVPIIVQSMVFGNLGHWSGSGICSTRHPATGDRVLFGEYLRSSEGDEMLSSFRAPSSLDDLRLKKPEVYERLVGYAASLENHYQDMQDIHFTVENRRLYILKSMPGWRSAKASVRVAVDMVREGILTTRDALLRVNSRNMRSFLFPCIDPLTGCGTARAATGFGASPGAGSGILVFDTDRAMELIRGGEAVVLCKISFSEEDKEAIKHCQGVICFTGGQLSQSALLARHMGTPAVVGTGFCSCGTSCIGCHGCPNESASVAPLKSSFTSTGCKCGSCLPGNLLEGLFVCSDGTKLRAGDLVTVDGTNGVIYRGVIAKTDDSNDANFRILVEWAMENKRMKTFVDTDSTANAVRSLQIGAEGCFCRTEKYFFGDECLDSLRKYFLCANESARVDYLARIGNSCRDNYLRILRELRCRHIMLTIVDPKLSDIFAATPKLAESMVRNVSLDLGQDCKTCMDKLSQLFELNPPSNMHGSNILAKYPELAVVQFRSLIVAACIASTEGCPAALQVLLPWATSNEDVIDMISRFKDIASEVIAANGTTVPYYLGCMLAVPRSCMQQSDGENCAEVDFIVINTDVLTEMVFGLSKKECSMSGILGHKQKQSNPFDKLDTTSVGSLVKTAVQRSRYASPSTKIGIVGNQTGDAESVTYLDSIGADFICCGPADIPSAILASAQANINVIQKKSKFFPSLFGIGEPSLTTMG